MSKKLHYFQLGGLAESIRYILHYGGHKFEDIRYAREDWPVKEVKDVLPYGQLPLYEEGDRTLNQSQAIARYVASQSNLLPSDPWEQAQLDAVVLNIYEFFSKLYPYLRETDPVKKEQLLKELYAGTMDFYLSRFEKQLKANNGYFGGKVSWADFILLGILEAVDLVFKTEIEKDYPTIVALFKKLRSLPGVKEYIANRPPYVI